MLYITFVGIPFSLNIGQMEIVGEKLYFSTKVRSHGMFINNGLKIEVDCHGKRSCLQLVDKRKVKAGIPFFLEECHQSDHQRIFSCDKPHLVVASSTALWMRQTLLKR
jgi:hypothetical protein